MIKIIILFVLAFIGFNNVSGQCVVNKAEFMIHDTLNSEADNKYLKDFNTSGFYVDIIEVRISSTSSSPIEVSRIKIKRGKNYLICKIKTNRIRKRYKIGVNNPHFQYIDSLVKLLERGSYVFSCPHLYESNQTTVRHIKVNGELVFSLLQLGSNDLPQTELVNYQRLIQFLLEPK